MKNSRYNFCEKFIPD